MNQLAMNSPEMSECDILHTLRWSSRLRVSSYVNWIKVLLSLLLWGSQPAGSDLGNLNLRLREALDPACFALLNTFLLL